MGDRSKIEWTDATWNPIRARNRETGGVGHFCAKVSRGCKGCYAERLQARFQNPVRYALQDLAKVEVFLDPAVLAQPLRWKRPRVIFPCSMTDLFAEWHDDAFIDAVFAVMALTPQHTYKVLTKRTARMRRYITHWPDGAARFHHVRYAAGRLLRGPSPGNYSFADEIGARASAAVAAWPLPNVQLFASVEDQETADARIPDLLATPAALHGVSYEPALGPVDFTKIDRRTEDGHEKWTDALRGTTTIWDPARKGGWGGVVPAELRQVIAGGQSGADATPSHPDWFRSARDQCAEAGVAFFFKQWGEWLPVGQILPGYGKVHGATAVKPGRMKLHYGGTPQQAPKHAFADGGVEVASLADGFLTFRVGKKAAGRLLDGALWDQQPPAAAGRVA